MSVTSGDGTDLDVSDWEIHENRWLVHAADAWPDDDQIVFAVVYGEDPPIDVLRARDHVLYQMIMSNNPATSFVDGQMTVTENGRTMVINADGKSRLHEAVTKDYKRRSVSSFDDPAEDSVAFIEFV